VIRNSVAPIIVAGAVALSVGRASAQSTAFTFQGVLKDAGSPVNGSYDIRFRLFDAVSGGAQVGNQFCIDNVPVANGLFTTSIDFGQQFATPAGRFLEIAVRRDTGANCGSAGGFVTLAPRQALTAAPLANHAKSAFALDAADGSPANAVFVDNAGMVGIGTPSPFKALHVLREEPALILQDTGIDSTQWGYVDFRNNSGTSTAWMGFGTPGDPDVSIVNARTGGDIVLSPFSGNVGIGTPSPAQTLHVASDNPIMVLQDTGADPFLQSSRISLRDNAGVETGAMGFDASSLPDISIVNQRLGGHILLLPSTSPSSEGRVGIGAVVVPQDKLDVDGGLRLRLSAANEDLKIYNASGARIWMMGLSDEFPANPSLRMISPFSGDYQATMQRDPQTGGGSIIADIKNFRAPNPADPTTDIWYCCPEGPEAAMYVRGTARLVNGQARIELPDHFRNLAVEAGMTVQVTPLDADSKGLAVTAKRLNGIEVRELAGGAGTYEFDWRVEAVRKGFENYQVIRPWMRSDPDEAKAWQNRLKGIEERKAHGMP